MVSEVPFAWAKGEKVDDNLELWLYIIKNTSLIDEDKMRIIVDKNPAMRETLGELKQLSIDPEVLSLEEMRRKSRMDYESTIAESKAEGIEKGKAEVAKAMLAEGEPISKITRWTGLPEEEISKLKSEIDKN